MRWHRVIVGIRLILATFLCSSALGMEAPRVAGAEVPADPSASSRDHTYWAPVTDIGGRVTQLRVRVCEANSESPQRLVVINHGSPPNPAERPRMQLGKCEQEAAQWFLKRGYAVAFALRRGYGETGGSRAETYEGCSHAEFVRAGLETARDIDAVVNFATALPFVRRDGAIVIGQSAGGWGTLAYNALSHPKVSAFIVMAGGRGGHEHDRPNSNRHPVLLVQAARLYGKTASTPMLWIYARNDTYFSPHIAADLRQAYGSAGVKIALEQPGSYDDEGHHLFLALVGLKSGGRLSRNTSPSGK